MSGRFTNRKKDGSLYEEEATISPVRDGIVKQHNGFIEISSTKNNGSTFYIYFPAIKKPLSGEQRKINLSSIDGDTETILVVEDEDAVRNVIQRLLNDLGYTVLTAKNSHSYKKI